MNEFTIANTCIENELNTKDTINDKLDSIPMDTINYIYGFLQRTDQIAWKLTSKFYYCNLTRDSMDLNSELCMYTKTIDELEYAWKGDTRYIKIEKFPSRISKKYSILSNYVVLTDLWYFDFNAEFDICTGNYIILCLTSVCEYTINIEFTNGASGKITETAHNPVSNKIKVKFDACGKIKVNCREVRKYKNLKTIQYIMCIPEYYWKKIQSYRGTHGEWKKQIVMTNDGFNGQKVIRYFY